MPVNAEAVRVQGSDNVTVIASTNSGKGAVLVGTAGGEMMAAVQEDGNGSGGRQRVAACVGDFFGEPHLVTLSAGPASGVSGSEASGGDDDDVGADKAAAAAAAATAAPPTPPINSATTTTPPQDASLPTAAAAAATPPPPLPRPAQPNSQIAVGIDSMGLFRVLRLDGKLTLLGTGDGRCLVPASPVPEVPTPVGTTPSTKRKRKEEAAAAAAAAAEPQPGTTDKVDVIVSTALSDDQHYMAVSSQSGVYLYDLSETGWLDPPPQEDKGENEENDGGDGGGGEEATAPGGAETDGAAGDVGSQGAAAAAAAAAAVVAAAEPAAPEEATPQPRQPTLVFQVEAPAQPATPAVPEAFFEQVQALCISQSPQPLELVGDAAAAAAAATAAVEAAAEAEAEHNMAKSRKGGKSTPDAGVVEEAAAAAKQLVAAATEAAAEAEQVVNAKRVLPQFHNVGNKLVLSVAWKGDNQLRWMPAVVGSGGCDDGQQQEETKTVFSRAAISACVGDGAGTMAIGMVDGGVSVYDMQKQHLLACFQNGSSPVSAITFTPSGVLAVGGADGEVSLFNIVNNTKLEVLLSLLDELPDNGANLSMSNRVVAVVCAGGAAAAGPETVIIAQSNGRIVEINSSTGSFLSLYLIPAPWLINPGSLVIDGTCMFVKAKLYGDESSTVVFRFQLYVEKEMLEENNSAMAREEGQAVRQDEALLPLATKPLSFANVRTKFLADLESKRAARQARIVAALERV